MQGSEDNDLEQYVISAALIASGLCSFVQVMRFGVRAPKWWHADRIYLGTGFVSLMGTSFTFLPIAQTTIGTLIDGAHAASFSDLMLALYVSDICPVCPLWVQCLS